MGKVGREVFHLLVSLYSLFHEGWDAACHIMQLNDGTKIALRVNFTQFFDREAVKRETPGDIERRMLRHFVVTEFPETFSSHHKEAQFPPSCPFAPLQGVIFSQHQ